MSDVIEIMARAIGLQNATEGDLELPRMVYGRAGDEFCAGILQALADAGYAVVKKEADFDHRQIMKSAFMRSAATRPAMDISVGLGMAWEAGVAASEGGGSYSAHLINKPGKG